MYWEIVTCCISHLISENTKRIKAPCLLHLSVLLLAGCYGKSWSTVQDSLLEERSFPMWICICHTSYLWQFSGLCCTVLNDAKCLSTWLLLHSVEIVECIRGLGHDIASSKLDVLPCQTGEAQPISNHAFTPSTKRCHFHHSHLPKWSHCRRHLQGLPVRSRRALHRITDVAKLWKPSKQFAVFTCSAWTKALSCWC